MNLLKTEWLKIKNYPAFWWVFGIITLSYPGINYIMFQAYKEIGTSKNMAAQMANYLLGNPFSFPEAWHTIGYFSSIFIFIPSILVIMLITNEYVFKTHRQNIIDGWSRKEFLTGKMLGVVLISLMVTLIYVLVTLVIGWIQPDQVKEVADAIQKNTLGVTPTLPAPNAEGNDILKEIRYIPLFALQTFSQLSVAFMVGFLIRRSFIALAIFIFYFMILEPIAVGLMRLKADDLGRFMPLELSDRLIPVPAFFGKLNLESYNKALEAVTTHTFITIVFTAGIWGLCYYLNSKRDL